jgi:hypothetical protein
VLKEKELDEQRYHKHYGKYSADDFIHGFVRFFSYIIYIIVVSEHGKYHFSRMLSRGVTTFR